MRICLEIPDEFLEEIDEEITTNSHNECGDGPLPSEGAWAVFQAAWWEAFKAAKEAHNGQFQGCERSEHPAGNES